MENNSSENLNNNMIYNDNNIQNYEELACCSNSIITTFIQENGNYILNYINDLCFRDVSVDDEAQIINNPNQKLETPLCSNNKNNNNNNNNNNFITNNIDNQINNYNNNENNNNIYNRNNGNNQNNQNNNNHSLNNSFRSGIINNPSNDSAAEPIMSDQKYRENIFTKIKNIFKDFFSDKKEEKQNRDNISGSALNINLKNINDIKRGDDNNNILALSQFNQNFNSQRNRQNNYNALKHTNSHLLKRPQLFADNILSFNISEEKEDETLKLVSFIPVFTVKDKNKTDEGMNKCTICITDFEIGDKKSTLPCLHSFHSNCIEKWIKKKKYCPICKFQISLESLKDSLEQL